MSSSALQYQSGFGNEFASEAAPGALPVGQNAPQQPPLGLYAEQLSGSAFTAPRALNRRTWTYRIRPSVTHKPFSEHPPGLIRGAVRRSTDAAQSTALESLPDPVGAHGLRRWPGDARRATADPAAQSGVAIHIYAANASMQRRYFYSADGELLIVPQQGRTRIATELGVLEWRPARSA